MRSLIKNPGSSSTGSYNDPFPRNYSLVGIIFLCIVIFLSLLSCGGSLKVGIKKDLSTGMVATYKNLEPGDIYLVMNGEVLNHTDIPLGESFLLVNSDIQGLHEIGGKVSLGCSLTIMDQDGLKVLEEKDLFAGRDIFDENEVDYLKCTINTGQPMQWEENYRVVATFWDKFGDGRITNEVSIRPIDIP